MPRSYTVISINGHIVPATYHDALKKMRHQISIGRVSNLSKTRYATRSAFGWCHCGIGATLTKPQLASILNEPKFKKFGGGNREDWGVVADFIGERNTDAVLSMGTWHAKQLQKAFDQGGVDAITEHIDYGLRYSNNYPNPAIKHTGAWHFPVSEE